MTLAELIKENPNLPLKFMVGEDANIDYCGYMLAELQHFEKGKILNSLDFERVYTDKEDLIEYIADCWDCHIHTPEEQASWYDDEWEDCILIYVDN